MGYVITHPSTVFNVEVKRESLLISEHFEEWPHEFTKLFGDGRPVAGIEVERQFLEELLAFFDNPANRALCRLHVPPMLEAGE